MKENEPRRRLAIFHDISQLVFSGDIANIKSTFDDIITNKMEVDSTYFVQAWNTRIGGKISGANIGTL